MIHYLEIPRKPAWLPARRPGRFLTLQVQRIKEMADKTIPVNPSESYIMPEKSEESNLEVCSTDQSTIPEVNEALPSASYTAKKSLPIGQVTLIILALVLILPSLAVLVRINSNNTCNEGSLQLRFLVFEYHLTT